MPKKKRKSSSSSEEKREYSGHKRKIESLKRLKKELPKKYQELYGRPDLSKAREAYIEAKAKGREGEAKRTLAYSEKKFKQYETNQEKIRRGEIPSEKEVEKKIKNELFKERIAYANEKVGKLAQMPINIMERGKFLKKPRTKLIHPVSSNKLLRSFARGEIQKLAREVPPREFGNDNRSLFFNDEWRQQGRTQEQPKSNGSGTTLNGGNKIKFL